MMRGTFGIAILNWLSRPNGQAMAKQCGFAFIALRGLARLAASLSPRSAAALKCAPSAWGSRYTLAQYLA
jgi:hypothetical protein